MIQSKSPGAGAILSRISVILSLAAHFSINEASPVGNPFPEDMIRDPTLVGIDRFQSTPPNPNAFSNVDGSSREFSHWSTSSTPGNINDNQLFATLQERLVPQRDAAPAFHDFAGSSHHFSHLQEYDPHNHAENSHLGASNVRNHILGKQSLYHATDGLQTSRDWIPSPGYDYDRDWIQDFSRPVTPETMSENIGFSTADDNLLNHAPWNAHPSTVAGPELSVTHKADNPSQELDPITFTNNGDALKYFKAPDVYAPGTSETLETRTDEPRGEHDSRAMCHQDGSKQEGPSNRLMSGLGLKLDHTGVLLDAQRLLERQHHAGISLLEKPSPSLSSSAEPPCDSLSNNINDANGSQQSRKRKANKLKVEHNPQTQRKLDRLGLSRSAMPNTALGHSREQQVIKSNSDQDFLSVRAVRRPRRRKSGELLKEKSYMVAQDHPGSSLPETSSLGSGGGVEKPRDLSAHDNDNADGLQLSKKLRGTKPATENIIGLFKHASLVAAKRLVLKHVAKRMRKDQQDLEAHVNVLETVTEIPVKLLANGNFNANEALSCLLGNNRLTAQNNARNQIILERYLESYKTCYRSKVSIQHKLLRKTKQKSSRSFLRSDSIRNSNAQYIAGRKRFSGTDIGNSVEKLENKWLNLILERYPSNHAQNWQVLLSWYEFIRRSSTCLLYQVELLFRLSIPISGFTEIDKDLALKNLLKSLDELWSNSPIFETTQVHKKLSSISFYEDIFDDIKSLKEEDTLTPRFFEVTRLLFSTWYKRQNFLLFEKMKLIPTMRTNKKKATMNLMGPQLFALFQDCAWVDYISMKDSQDLAGVEFPIQSGSRAT